MKLPHQVVDGAETKGWMMKNRLRNIVSPLTPRNYPNMRELFLYLFCHHSSIPLFALWRGTRNIVTTHAHWRDEEEEEDKIIEGGGKFINCRLNVETYAWYIFDGISMPIIYFPSKRDWRLFQDSNGYRSWLLTYISRLCGAQMIERNFMWIQFVFIKTE